MSTICFLKWHWYVVKIQLAVATSALASLTEGWVYKAGRQEKCCKKQDCDSSLGQGSFTNRRMFQQLF